MSFIVCYRTCWSCKFDDHPEKPHPWYDMDDVDSAEWHGTEPPTGGCNCYCNPGGLEKEENDEAVGPDGHGSLPPNAA